MTGSSSVLLFDSGDDLVSFKRMDGPACFYFDC